MVVQLVVVTATTRRSRTELTRAYHLIAGKALDKNASSRHADRCEESPRCPKQGRPATEAELCIKRWHEPRDERYVDAAPLASPSIIGAGEDRDKPQRFIG